MLQRSVFQPLNITLGVVATALPFGLLVASQFHRWRLSGIAILGASAAAALWTICYGVFAWQHRWDWADISNCPLWVYFTMMGFAAVIYALAAFPAALAGAALCHKLRKRHA